MIETLSYGVSATQLLSSKQVPASGRVCSWRKPSVCPSSWPRMFAGVHEPLVCSDVALTRMLRPLFGVLGKNARAMY